MSDQPRAARRPKRAPALLVKTWDNGEATIIRQLLASYGIPSQVVSHVTHSVLPIGGQVGEIRILVPASRLDDARTLIAEHRRSGLSVVPGGKRVSLEGAAARRRQGGG